MRLRLEHSAPVKCAVSLSAPAAQLAALSHHMVEGAQQAIWSGSDAFRLHLTSAVEPLGARRLDGEPEYRVTGKVVAGVPSVSKWSRMMSATDQVPCAPIGRRSANGHDG